MEAQRYACNCSSLAMIYSIPKGESIEFEAFYFMELLLYKPFGNISSNIGLSAETIIENWRNFHYCPQHIDRDPSSSDVVEDDEDLHAEPTNVDEDIEEWQLFPRLVPPNNIDVSNLDTLGQRDFDLCFNWEETIISNDAAEAAIDFIRTIQSTGVVVTYFDSAFVSPSSQSEKE